MGCDLPKIHIEWDEAHAAGLQPELRTYRQIVIRLGSHEGVETSLDDDAAPPPPSAAPTACEPAATDDAANSSDESDILDDVREMRRSLSRMRELGATVMIDGREANSATLDAYEDTLARALCAVGACEGGGGGRTLNAYGGAGGNGFLGGGLLSSVVYIVGLAVVFQWLFRCS